jgi:hypothetical protein
MGNELDGYVYDYDTRGDDGCPLLVLIPVDESRPVFRRGRGRGYAAAAATTSWREQRGGVEDGCVRRLPDEM